MARTPQKSLLDAALLREAAWGALRKLNPRALWRNPVMLAVELAGAFTLGAFLLSFMTGPTSGPTSGPTVGGGSHEPLWFTGMVSLWLWLTVLFSTFAEALAEGRGKARASSLRASRGSVAARRVSGPEDTGPGVSINATELRKGDCIRVEAGEVIPADGDIINGAALVNESAITGESAPVAREAGGDRSAVTGGTTVTVGTVLIRVSADPGSTFLDRMIGLIEGAKRRKTPNEIALEVLLLALTLVFFLVCLNLRPLSAFSAAASWQGAAVSFTVLTALFVCLAPTTIAALLPVIGIAGMDRLFRKNVIALSGRAVEAAGDVSVLLLDKTGTITYGNRQAVAFLPVGGHTEEDVARAALLSSLADETAEGRSIVTLAKSRFGLELPLPQGAVVVDFSAETRLSGLDIDEGGAAVRYRKGASDAVLTHVAGLNAAGTDAVSAALQEETLRVVEEVAHAGATPLVVCRDAVILGVVNLKDIVKEGLPERFAQLRAMGITTVMITGDNPLTAAAIAAEARVDDFLPQAKPEDKLRMIRQYQDAGQMVAMTGDGTNDAPALAQADVAVAMNTGTQPAREAANIIDLDSNPTKLLDIVEVGKQILMTRGNLTTFSIANDVAKYFAIIPAMLLTIYPQLAALNVMNLASPHSAILSAVIFNALIIPLLAPLALRGTAFRPLPAEKLLVRSLCLYGAGGVIAPFAGIKCIDLCVGFLL